PVLKPLEGYFGMDLVNLNHGQRMRATPNTPNAVSPFQDFLATPAGRRLTFDVRCSVNQARMCGGPLVESGFDPRTSSPELETL
ncbi:hypothetical protein AVEN_134165-1, partial [Araneus ventricosus]